MVLRTSRIDWMRWKNDMQVDKKRRLESLLFCTSEVRRKEINMEKNMKKRPHDFLWRGSQMESKLMPGKEVTQQRTHNSKTFDLGRARIRRSFILKPFTSRMRKVNGRKLTIDLKKPGMNRAKRFCAISPMY